MSLSDGCDPTALSSFPKFCDPEGPSIPPAGQACKCVTSERSNVPLFLQKWWTVTQVTSITSSGPLSSLPLTVALSVHVINKGLKSV